jgi:hypothetical protein
MSTIREFPRYTINEKSEIYDTLKEKVISQCNVKGYKYVHLTNETGDRKNRYIHRLIFEAFILKDGETMPEEVDHIDNNKTNNQIANLRAATRQQNERNNPKSKTNKSGYKNVYITKYLTYQVRVRITRDVTYVSEIFKDLQEAVDDAIRAREENHADFSRH